MPLAVLLCLGVGCGDLWIDAIDAAPTWEDDTSGSTLIWQTTDAGRSYDLNGATVYCEGLSLGGATDWRLPTISELRSLVRGCLSLTIGGACGVSDGCLSYSSCLGGCDVCSAGDGPGADGCHWDATLYGTCSWYWSSSPSTDHTGLAWYLDFERGEVSSHTVGLAGRVRCVR